MLKINKQRSEFKKVLFFAIAVLVPLIFLIGLPRLLIPFGIAYILMLMLRPFKTKFIASRPLQRIMMFFFAVLMMFFITYPVVGAIKLLTEESSKIEFYLPKLENYLRQKYDMVKTEVKDRWNYELDLRPVDKITEVARVSTQSLISYLPRFLGSLLEWGFMIPLFLFFLLKDGRKFRVLMLGITPNSIIERTYYLFHQFNTKFGDYILAKFIEACIVGSIITTGLFIMGNSFALLLGLVAGILNLLPYLGPILGYIPALLLGLVDPETTAMLGPITILYTIANIIDLAFVFPILVSKIVNLHPMIVVVSVILGSQFAGIIGMVVSIPLAAITKLLFIEIFRVVYGDHSRGSFSE